MKMLSVFTLAMLAYLLPLSGARAGDAPAPYVLAPASIFTAKDLPEVDPGKPIWDSTRGWGITYYRNWVYAVSAAEYILQFECDPATAKLTYKGAIPLGYRNPDSGRFVSINTWIRRMGNQAKLILFYGDHHKGLTWYSIDKGSGVITLDGIQYPALCDHHNATQLVAPNSQHFCYGGRLLDKVDWYRLGDDGLPLADGSIAMKNASTGNGGMSSGCVMTDPDWNHLYCMVFQCPDNDPKNDKTPFIDTYDLDLKTYSGVYKSTLELPVPATVQGRVSGTLEPFSPDGKFTYAIFRAGNTSYYYTLARDPQSGALSIAGQKPTTDAGNLGLLTGAPWSRQGRFAYADDGLSGYFVNDGPLERFTRDLTTGALTLLPPLPEMGAAKLALDPANSLLFTAGEKIASFKISKPEAALDVK